MAYSIIQEINGGNISLMGKKMTQFWLTQKLLTDELFLIQVCMYVGYKQNEHLENLGQGLPIDQVECGPKSNVEADGYF